MAKQSRSFHLMLLLTFAFAIFGSAALLFNIQPMVGKMLLPRVGGAPAVWNVAMAFFETALLIGYLIAHLLSRASLLVHGLVYIIILLLAATHLPISLPAGWQPDPHGFPPLDVTIILFQTVALPFIALSLSAPTLQRLFSGADHPDSKDPYFLYAASNLGSFIGLLAYPLLLEPKLTVPGQTGLWQDFFTLFLFVAAACLLPAFRNPKAKEEVVTDGGPPVTNGQRLQWLFFAALPSSLTLGATTHITTDVVSVPLIWALILGLYLLTFVLAFNPPKKLKASDIYFVQPWLILIAILLTGIKEIFQGFASIIPHLFAFTFAALTCHLRLVAARPSVKHLTEFYLWISIGGAVGGLITAFLLPVIFLRPSEYVLGLLLSLAANPRADFGSDRKRILSIAGFVLLTALFCFAEAARLLPEQREALRIATYVALFTATALIAVQRRHLIIALYAAVTIYCLFQEPGNLRYIGRNFFGVTRVVDVVSETVEGRTIRYLAHGTTRHTIQIITPKAVNEPNGYYSPYSPVAAIYGDHRLKRVAVFGLGAGNMNCFTAPGRSFHFFEIDPMMVEVAQHYFTYLKDCPPPEITVGDARIALTAEKGRLYDLIVMDAFSSDYIPAHLITTDALKSYLGNLAPDGVIVVHVSNRFFDLRGMLAKNAEVLGLAALSGYAKPPAGHEDIYYPSAWIAFAKDRRTLAPYIGKNGWEWAQTSPYARAWTDEFSNLLSVLK